MTTTKMTLTIEERKRRKAELVVKLPEILQVDPVITITLRGADYKIELDNQGVIDFLKDTGVNLLGDGLDLDAMENPEIMGHLLHRGLQYHHKDLTIEAVNGLIEFRKFAYIREKILDSVRLILPIPEEQAMGEEAHDTEDPK